jgi:hypothetical protein
MTSLAQLQSAFQQHLLTGEEAIATHIRDSGIGTARRLHIYHHAYRMRLVDTLRDSFGHTLLYLGDERFNAAALAHVEGHASTHPSLRWYGADFPETLAARFDEAPEVAELAQLDWALRHAFDGPDAPVLTLADLAALAPECWADVGFNLHPTYARLQLQHNTLAIWQALDDDGVPPEAAPLAEPGELMIWRRGHQPHFRSLQALEAAALSGLQGGMGFAAVCATLADQFASADMTAEVGGLLRRWVDEELLSALRWRSAAP